MEEQLSDWTEIIQKRILEKRFGGKVIAAKPKVSVVIPVYNSSEFIVETLTSVFAQTYQNYEVILVNDGSTDTPQLEKEIQPFLENIIYVRQENEGASSARNVALCLARADIIAFLDSDDIWLPEFLDSQVKFLETNNFDLVYCDAELFGAKMFAGKTFMKTSPSNGVVTSENLIAGKCNIINSGTLAVKECFQKLGLFDKSLIANQDYDMWFRLLKNGIKAGFQKTVLLKYRVRPDSVSGGNVERAKRSIFSLNVIAEKYKLSPTEKAAWDKQMRASEAFLELEQGKFCLVNENYEQALQHFNEANKYFHRFRFMFITWILKIYPKLALVIFKTFRPAEFVFIAPNNH